MLVIVMLSLHEQLVVPPSAVPRPSALLRTCLDPYCQ